MVLWGVERFLDEQLWLHGTDGALGSYLVQLAGLALVVAGGALIATRVRPYRTWRTSRPDPPEPPDGSADADAVTGDPEGAVAADASTAVPGSSANGE
jgi:hypothetical protein